MSDAMQSESYGRRWVFESMYTVFSLVVAGVVPPNADDLVAEIRDEFGRIESRLSVFQPDTEISRWRAGRLAYAKLSAETRAIITDCDLAEELTGGLFSARRDGEYDPTGYVKGWALAQAGRMLTEAGIGSYCLNGGGDITARGVNGDGAPWQLGVAHPYRAGEMSIVIAAPVDDGRPIAVATSGTTERGAHISNPLDGWRPVNSSVTVVGHDIAFVDMAATAAVAAGKDGSAAPAALVQRLGLEAFGFDENRHPWWTPGMTKYALLPEFK